MAAQMNFSVLSTIESPPDLQNLKVNSARSKSVKEVAVNVKEQSLLEVNSFLHS